MPLRLGRVSELSEADLDELVAQATVDCYNEDEELAGLAVMLEDNLAVPFETTVLGVPVTVRKIDQTESGIVAICVRGKHRQAAQTDLCERRRPSPSWTCRCQTRLPGAPNGSPPTAAGRDRSRHG